MTEAPITATEIHRLLDEMVGRAGPVDGAVLSSDGLVVASSSGIERDDSEHLSALVAGMQGLARGACGRFAGGDVMQTVIELDTMLVFMVPVGEQSCLAVLAAPDVDAGAVVYEMTELAERLAERPPADRGLSGSGTR